jgi:hypothetical protein
MQKTVGRKPVLTLYKSSREGIKGSNSVSVYIEHPHVQAKYHQHQHLTPRISSWLQKNKISVLNRILTDAFYLLFHKILSDPP